MMPANRRRKTKRYKRIHMFWKRYQRRKQKQAAYKAMMDAEAERIRQEREAKKAEKKLEYWYPFTSESPFTLEYPFTPERDINQPFSHLLRCGVCAYRKAIFIGLPDHRADNTVHEVADVLCCCMICMAMGENHVSHMAELIKNKPDEIRWYMGVTREEVPVLPSKSTILRVLASTSHALFAQIVHEWAKIYALEEVNHICVDGKAYRAALEKILARSRCPFTLNCFDANNGLYIYQIPVGEKTNEYKRLPDLVDDLGYMLDGVTATLDAGFIYTNTFDKFTFYGANVIVALKENQENAYNKVLEYIFDFDNAEKVSWYIDDALDKNEHGRRCFRAYGYISEGVDKLFEGTRFEGKIHSVGVAVRTTKKIQYKNGKDGEESYKEAEELTLYACSHKTPLSVEQFANYVRRHWGGCESIHFILDTEFQEDHSRLRKGESMENMGLIRKAVLTMLRTFATQFNTRGGSLHNLRGAMRDLCGIPADWINDGEAADAFCQKIEDNMIRFQAEFLAFDNVYTDEQMDSALAAFEGLRSEAP